MKSAWVLLLVGFGLISSASALPRSASDLKAFQRDLRDELQSRLRTLDRPIRMYHYGNRGPLRHSAIYPNVEPGKLRLSDQEAIELKRGRPGENVYQTPVELNPPEAAQYFQAMSGHFKDQDPDWLIGQGLYAAVDPVQSESYMGNPWFLLEISAPKGMRYLEVRPDGGIVVSEAFIKKWVVPESNRPFDRFDGVEVRPHEYRLAIFNMLELPKLNALLQGLLAELKVDAMAYPWAPTTISLCRKVSRNQSMAFNFMNPVALQRGVKLKLFVQNLEPDASAEKKAEYSRVLDLIEASEIQWNGSMDLTTLAWGSESIQARVRTLGWNRVLQRRPILETLFSFPQSVEQLEAAFVRGERASFPLRLAYRPAVLKTDPRLVAERGLGGLFIDPLLDLGQKDPATFATRKKMIQESVFGCHPNYPRENDLRGL